jgi:peptidoglycan/xylan/chitin deacetylase (PgdA/CDA1 family)
LTARDYRLVSLETAAEALSGTSPRRDKLACLTFDDGYRDFYTHAFPLLQEYGAPATVFLVAGCIGATNRWDDCYGLPSVPLLNREEILELAAQGVEFGSHTVSHRRLTRLSTAAQKREIFDSKKALEDLLNHPIRFFCYPHIAHDAHVEALVRDAGYSGACGGEQAANSPYLLHRVNVSQTGRLSTLFRLWGWRYSLQRSRGLRALKRTLLPSRSTSPELTEVRR